ncbi:MAG: DUF4329 domain-containing protein [Pseudomonadota bacterium]
MRLSLAATVAALSLAMAPTVQSQSADEVALAKEVLSSMQQPSFDDDREYCGYLAYDQTGDLVGTPISRGARDSCVYEGPEDGFVMAFSIHTHGRYSPDIPAEFPSVGDMEADEDEGVDGFVATPGGRLWYVDTEDMLVRQICGIGCLPQDPRFRPGDDGVVEISYTYEELLELEGN